MLASEARKGFAQRCGISFECLRGGVHSNVFTAVCWIEPSLCRAGSLDFKAVFSLSQTKGHTESARVAGFQTREPYKDWAAELHSEL